MSRSVIRPKGSSSLQEMSMNNSDIQKRYDACKTALFKAYPNIKQAAAELAIEYASLYGWLTQNKVSATMRKAVYALEIALKYDLSECPARDPKDVDAYTKRVFSRFGFQLASHPQAFASGLALECPRYEQVLQTFSLCASPSARNLVT